MKVVIFLCLFLGNGQGIFGQEISLPDSLTSHTPNLQFSSLAKWNNKVLLIPQMPQEFRYQIFGLDEQGISKFLSGNTPVMPISFFFDSAQFEEIIQPLSFDGIEATAVISDRIYFCIETKVIDSPCYIISGIINEESQITLDNTVFRLPRPTDTRHRLLTRDPNYGFESLVHLKKSNEFLAVFEKNNAPGVYTAYKFSTTLQGGISRLSFRQTIESRITDLAADDSGKLYAVNFVDNSQHYKTNILRLTLQGNRVNAQIIKTVSVGRRDNWEGMVIFNKGVLMVIDGYPCSANMRPCTKLKYFKF